MSAIPPCDRFPDLLLDPIEYVQSVTRCWTKGDIKRALQLAIAANNQERVAYWQKRLDSYKPTRTRRDGRA